MSMLVLNHSKPAWLLAALAALAWFAVAAPVRADDAKALALFENKIRPVLIKECYQCHSKDSKVRGGLLLDTRDGIRTGGDTGPAVVPGDPDKSLILKALHHKNKLKMPPKKKLSDAVIADFTLWIKLGAADPRTANNVAYKRMTPEEAKNHWAFKPVSKPTPPKVSQTSWPRGDIDRFILAKLEAKKLAPVADANRRTLIRRLSLDLTGLPPSPEEVAAFAADRSEKAVEKLVDRLLASKHFGERWGRQWLDLARYAETNGNVDNTPFPQAWRYRDYVIKALNDDKPYDRFVTEQIAGDLLSAKDNKQKDELLIATGFLALTSKPRAQNNPEYRMDLVADQIDVTTRSVLGLTVMCARCHDHKFDAIATKEYYALAGIFNSTQMLTGIGGKGAKKGGGPQALLKLSSGAQAMGVRETRVVDCAVCVRGESRNRGETVKRGFLVVATPGKAPTIPSGVSGRLQLAQWLTARDNPLTARVAANRVWQGLFGRGLVTSPDNFGALGEKPSHPELLDHLASRFMEDGWSIKKLIRQIVLSRTYQLASAHHATNYKVDPDNVMLWRMNVRRLDGEQIRDSMLAVSGNLDLTPPKGSKLGAPAGKGNRIRYAQTESNCRSVYLGMPRGAPLPELLGVFDVANPNLVVAQREVTTVPAQALFLMNSKFVLDQAKTLAKRLQGKEGLDTPGRIDMGYQLALGRPATKAESARVAKFLGEKPDDTGWTSFCQVLLASAEFRYLE